MNTHLEMVPLGQAISTAAIDVYEDILGILAPTHFR